GFVVSLDAQLHPRWGTYWGSSDAIGAGSPYLLAIAVNGAGEVYFGGSTYSTNLPFLPPAPANPSAGFLVKLNNSGHFVNGDYTMRLGAKVYGIALFQSVGTIGSAQGPDQQVYCTGIQYTDGPTDTSDVFVVKLDEGIRVASGPPLSLK